MSPWIGIRICIYHFRQPLLSASIIASGSIEGQRKSGIGYRPLFLWTNLYGIRVQGCGELGLFIYIILIPWVFTQGYF